MTMVYIFAGILIVLVMGSRILKPSLPDGGNTPVSGGSTPTLADVEALVRQGHELAAIKAYRQINRCGLKEAKAAIERMAGKAPALATPDEIRSQIRDLLRQGNKIQAIKVYRSRFDCGLKEAKEAVEALEAGHEGAAFQGLMPEAQPPAKTSARTPAASLETIQRLVREGNQIGAIKAYRELYGCGLKEAKQAVDRIAGQG